MVNSKAKEQLTLSVVKSLYSTACFLGNVTLWQLQPQFAANSISVSLMCKVHQLCLIFTGLHEFCICIISIFADGGLQYLARFVISVCQLVVAES